MTDVAKVIDGYIAIWNETDLARRRALIAETWADDANYVDPHMSAAGRDAIDAMVAGVQDRFPGHRFRLAGKADAHHDRVRFTWRLKAPNGGPEIAEGVDFATLAADGRLSAVTGFLNPLN